MKNIINYQKFIEQSDEPINELFSEVPTRIDEENVDKEIIRAAIIAELDAINLYEQFAAKTNNEKLKDVLLDIAKEEKTHAGEFEALLDEIDK